MIEIRIKKQGVVTHKGQFETQQQADEWIQSSIALRSWGKPERWVNEEDCSLQGEIISEAIAEQLIGGPENETKQYKFAAEYVIEQEDITAKVLQEEINAASLKYLAETDWCVIRFLESGVAVPAEVSTQRTAARAAIVH